jgi:hypothetical protein
MAALRYLDLIVLGLALPVFLAAGLPGVAWLAGGGAWVAQRAIREALERRAKASDDPRTVAGLTAGSMLARGWLVALTVFVVGVSTDNETGLSAAVLVVALFTVHFSSIMLARPFEGTR